MTLGHDDLIRPLGLEPARAPRRATLPLGQVFVGFVASLFMMLAAYLVFVKDPFGGEPYAIAVVERARRPDPLPPQTPAQQAPDAPDQPASSAGASGPQSAADAARLRLIASRQALKRSLRVIERVPRSSRTGWSTSR